MTDENTLYRLSIEPREEYGPAAVVFLPEGMTPLIPGGDAVLVLRPVEGAVAYNEPVLTVIERLGDTITKLEQRFNEAVADKQEALERYQESDRTRRDLESQLRRARVRAQQAERALAPILRQLTTVREHVAGLAARPPLTTKPAPAPASAVRTPAEIDDDELEF